MRIAVVLERAGGERRVAGTPDSVADLVADGHEVVVEAGAGVSAGMPDTSRPEPSWPPTGRPPSVPVG